MKKKILTRANALIVMLLSALGFAACETMQKYGVPESLEVLYGPMPDYGEPTSEEAQQEVPSASVVEENE